MVRWLMAPNPDDRPSAREVLRSELLPPTVGDEQLTDLLRSLPDKSACLTPLPSPFCFNPLSSPSPFLPHPSAITRLHQNPLLYPSAFALCMTLLPSPPCLHPPCQYPSAFSPLPLEVINALVCNHKSCLNFAKNKAVDLHQSKSCKSRQRPPLPWTIIASGARQSSSPAVSSV